jgi:hypothetical protein
MHKLVLILIAFIAAVTFIRAFDKEEANLSASDISVQQGSTATQGPVIMQPSVAGQPPAAVEAPPVQQGPTAQQAPTVSAQIATNSVSDL